MRRPAAAAVALLIPALVGFADAAFAQAPAGPPLSLENAKPIAIPPPPRLKKHVAPPAPAPLRTPELMTFPDVPQLATPAAVAPPPGPAGAPPVAKPRNAKPSVAAAPPPVSAAAEERVAAATQPAPVPAPPRAAPTTLSPPPVPAARAGMLAFSTGSALLPDDSEALLAAVAAEMRAAPTRRLQLRAYASGEVDSDRQARQLSLTRALAVRERLTALGVRSTRIDVRPLGAAPPPTEPARRDRVDLEYTSE